MRAACIVQPTQWSAEGHIHVLALTDKTVVDLFTVAPANCEFHRRIWCVIRQVIAEAKSNPIELHEGSPRRTAQGEASLPIRRGQ